MAQQTNETFTPPIDPEHKIYQNLTLFWLPLGIELGSPDYRLAPIATAPRSTDM